MNDCVRQESKRGRREEKSQIFFVVLEIIPSGRQILCYMTRFRENRRILLTALDPRLWKGIVISIKGVDIVSLIIFLRGAKSSISFSRQRSKKWIFLIFINIVNFVVFFII